MRVVEMEKTGRTAATKVCWTNPDRAVLSTLAALSIEALAGIEMSISMVGTNAEWRSLARVC